MAKSSEQLTKWKELEKEQERLNAQREKLIASALEALRVQFEDQRAAIKETLTEAMAVCEQGGINPPRWVAASIAPKQGGAPARGTGRKRGRNTSNLADALAELLAKAQMTVTEAAEKVQEAGYVTTSPNFRTIVNQTFLKDKRFKRVSRGVYTAKG